MGAAKGLKQQAIDIISAMPSKVSMDEIMEKLYFSTQVQMGLDDFKQGRTLSIKQAEKKLARWLTK